LRRIQAHQAAVISECRTSRRTRRNFTKQEAHPEVVVAVLAAGSRVAARNLVAAHTQAVAHSPVAARNPAAADSRAVAVDNPESTFGPTAPDAIPAGKTRKPPTRTPLPAIKKSARSGE
jgi:hypothetical protein